MDTAHEYEFKELVVDASRPTTRKVKMILTFLMRIRES